MNWVGRFLCISFGVWGILAGAVWAQDTRHAPQKKLIEYGWDVPTPGFIAQHIAEMEAKPFDGVIFKLKGGGQVLAPVVADPAVYADDFTLLPTIPWKKFTDNFVILWAASDQDWFNDEHWTAIEQNVKLCARAARLGRCAGVCFDAEPYGVNPWEYKTAAHRETQPFSAYEAKVRQRGEQFIRAMESEFPNPVVLTFFLLSMFGGLCRSMDSAARDEALSKNDYALLPAFLEGMIAAAGPETTFIDGNEPAYYYTNRSSYFEVYHLIAERARHMVDPALWEAYRAHVRVGQALYVDQYFGLREKKTLGNFMEPGDKAKWFEHNVFWALYTTDQYVWCYSERMNWWTNTDVPEGCEAAIRAALGTRDAGELPRFDLEPVIQSARQRMSEKP